MCLTDTSNHNHNNKAQPRIYIIPKVAHYSIESTLKEKNVKSDAYQITCTRIVKPQEHAQKFISLVKGSNFARETCAS